MVVGSRCTCCQSLGGTLDQCSLIGIQSMAPLETKEKNDGRAPPLNDKRGKVEASKGKDMGGEDANSGFVVGKKMETKRRTILTMIHWGV